MTKFEKYNVLDAIGYAARERRKALGLSQEDVAKALGVNRTLVTLFEKGQVASFWLLFYYIRYMCLNINYLPIYVEDEDNEKTND